VQCISRISSQKFSQKIFALALDLQHRRFATRRALWLGTSDLITGLVHLNCAGDVIQARNLQIVDCACDCRNRFRIEELTRIF